MIFFRLVGGHEIPYPLITALSSIYLKIHLKINGNEEWLRSEDISEEFYVITAWNPMGKKVSNEENLKNNKLLRQELM
jgi:hypothetical protein